jgi:thiamine-phosphate pyrophosphorylase
MAPMDRRARLRRTRLYFICDDMPGGRPLADVLPRALAGGVDLFQLRIKDQDDDAVVGVARQAREACDAAGALFVLNDRPELVQSTGADGVHVGQDDVAVARAREIVGPERLVGVSTHAPDQLAAAVAAGADYAGVGPVMETPTKPGRAAVGFEYVRHAAKQSQIPFFAIGGIDIAAVSAVAAAGSHRIAVVRAIAEAQDPEVAARALRTALETSVRSCRREFIGGKA